MEQVDADAVQARLRWLDVSAEHRAIGAKPTFGFPGQYDENGVDLSLIRENLKLTPTERARKAALRVLEIGRENRESRT